MELHYLYIGGREQSKNVEFNYLNDSPYKVLKDIELNFSNEFSFSFQKEEKQLIMRKNESFVPDFFDKSGKIKSVTGIIGKNGTGKSSILDLIMSLQSDNFEKQIYKLIIVFSDSQQVSGQEPQKIFKVYFHPELDFAPTTDTLQYASVFNTESKVPIKDFDQYKNILPTYTTIYYSTIFENKTTTIKDAFEVYGNKKIEDISTTKLLETDAGNHINGPTFNMSAAEVMKRHKLMETERQVKFIYHVKNAKDYLDFNPPQILELSVDHIDELTIKNKYKEAYNVLFQAFENYPKSNLLNAKERFIFQIHRAAFFNVMRYSLDNPIPFKDLNKILDEELKRDVSPENIRRFINYLATGFEEILMKQDIRPENPISRQLVLLSSMLETFSDLPETNFPPQLLTQPCAFIDLRVPKDYEVLKKYFDTVQLSGFIAAEWRFGTVSSGEMSSGERALISFFSRYYYVYWHMSKFSKTNKSLLFLIDEGDQLFHPEWQRKFMSRTLKFLADTFDFSESIQIILTTHSPFIASDLPPYSVIKLNKVNGRTVIEEMKPGESTFAANIHELFTDSFYLEKGLVGEFAVEKVKEMFDSLNSKKVAISPEIRKEIELVGEPFVKFSLLELLNKGVSNE